MQMEYERKKTHQFLLTIPLLIISKLSWGICTASNTSVHIPDIIYVQRDVANGTILATAQTSTTITCDKSGSNVNIDGSWLAYLNPNNVDNGGAGYGARNTTLKGVGLKWENLNSNTGVTKLISNSTLNNTSTQRGIAYNSSSTFTDTWSLVKTDSIVSGVFTLPKISWNYKTSLTNSDKGLLFTYNLPQIAIYVLACSISTPSVNVALEPISISKLAGPGTVYGDKTFTIGLNCDANARVNASLSGTQNRESTNTSVMALTNTGFPGVASGVGIQLLYGNSPLQLGKNIILKTSAGGKEFPEGAFTARYYQTQNRSFIKPGEASTTATLNLTYQ
ncbi:MAG: fimbrial protein [Hafnia sp.]